MHSFHIKCAEIIKMLSKSLKICAGFIVMYANACKLD